MKYKINALIYYDAADGSLTLNEGTTETQLTITANSLLFFFIQHPGIITRDEVLKKVWDDNGLVSSNSNLNQYLSLLRKTFRQYGIENIIVTIPKGRLELNPNINFELIDNHTHYLAEAIVDHPSEINQSEETIEEYKDSAPELVPNITNMQESINAKSDLNLQSIKSDICWYFASAALLFISLLLVIFVFFTRTEARPIALLPNADNKCELLSTETMINPLVKENYVANFNAVKDNLDLKCIPAERFIFFYGDKLQTNGLGRVFLAHCAKHEDNPFSYCDNYFYYSWKY